MLKTSPVLQSFHVRLGNKDKNLTVKNHKNGNQYLYIDNNIWVRNFTVPFAKPIDINKLYQDEEIKNFIDNENKNIYSKYPKFEPKDLSQKNIIIVSDGFGFENINNLLEKINLNKKFIVLTNNSLKKWNNLNVLPDLFIENNPFKECLNNISLKFYPNCLISTRTYHKFIDYYKYKNIKMYDPTPLEKYNTAIKSDDSKYLDDYRNSICAAINYSYFCNAKNLFLLFCSEAFEKQKPATILHNDGEHYQYPLNNLSEKIIDGMLFWLKKKNSNINIFYHGLNKTFNFASYIDSETLIEYLKL